MIEFFGMPGAGKTTAANALTKASPVTLVKVTGQADRIWNNILLAGRHPIRWTKLLLFVYWYSDTWWMFRYKFAMVMDYNVKYRKAKQVPYALVDQGHFQGAISMFEEPVTEAVLHDYIQTAFLPDRVVIFSIDPKTSLQRTAGRDYITARRSGRAAFEMKLAAMRKNFETILRMGVQVPYLVIDGNAPTEEAAAKIKAFCF